MTEDGNFLSPLPTQEKAKELYDYQKQAVKALLNGKKIIYAGCGVGKTPLSVVWAAEKCKLTNKKKILVISTPSKALYTQDFQEAFRDFVSPSFLDSLSSFSITSWHQLHKWVNLHLNELNEWVVIADEAARCSGWTTRMGRSFLKITKMTPDWSGYTGTPGDVWIKFGAYFQACGLISCKTQFVRRFCNVQTFKGYPEIVGYREENTLKDWWNKISYAPDTSAIEATIPKDNYDLIRVSKPRGYDKVIKLRQKMVSDGEFDDNPDYEEIIQNPSALTHYLRQLCFTKEKKQWLKDYFTDLGEPVVIFYNYKSTAEEIERIAKETIKGVRVWRIDGSHHDIPTTETIGKRDVVLAQWQSGGEALNLQFLRHLVAIELTYSWSTFKQAIGRIRRIGQTRPMFYKIIITNKTIEERILRCLKEKRDFDVNVWMGEEKLVDYHKQV